MFLSKLVNVIKAFDRDSFKRLQEYIHSPYFRVPTASIDLFDYLTPLYPSFSPHRITPETIAEVGANLSNRTKAARAGSELLQAIQYFIAMEDWQKHDLSVSWHQFNAMQQMQLMGEFEVEYEKTFERIMTDPEQDIETFFYRHTFTELATNGFDALLNRTIRNDLNPTLKTLDEFYALKLLRYMCEAVSRKQVLGIEYNEERIAIALKTLEPYSTKQYPYPYLFINVYQMLKAETYETGLLHYQLIKQFISNLTDKTLPPSSVESMSYSISWCLNWYSKGYEDASNEYLWWTDLKIKYGLLLENGKLLPITFRNVVSLAVLSDLPSDWMKKFIEEYSPTLPPEHYETNVAFAYGLYYYKAKNYTKATQSFLIAQAKEEVIFNAIIRRWQYMSTYEENPEDTDLLLNQLQSFEKYLLRNKKQFFQAKAIFIPFINYSKKILSIKSRNDISVMILQMEAEPFFPGKYWIRENLKQKIRL